VGVEFPGLERKSGHHPALREKPRETRLPLTSSRPKAWASQAEGRGWRPVVRSLEKRANRKLRGEGFSVERKWVPDRSRKSAGHGGRLFGAWGLSAARSSGDVFVGDPRAVERRTTSSGLLRGLRSTRRRRAGESRSARARSRLPPAMRERLELRGGGRAAAVPITAATVRLTGARTHDSLRVGAVVVEVTVDATPLSRPPARSRSAARRSRAHR
jgi:hypothetical protein